jgi:hypothetical protein
MSDPRVTLDGVLNDDDVAVLAVERQWWRYAGSKEQGIRDRFGWTATRYFQRLNELIDLPAAYEAEPTVIKRLRRVREVRQRDHAASPGREQHRTAPVREVARGVPGSGRPTAHQHLADEDRRPRVGRGGGARRSPPRSGDAVGADGRRLVRRMAARLAGRRQSGRRSRSCSGASPSAARRGSARRRALGPRRSSTSRSARPRPAADRLRSHSGAPARAEGWAARGSASACRGRSAGRARSTARGSPRSRSCRVRNGERPAVRSMSVDTPGSVVSPGAYPPSRRCGGRRRRGAAPARPALLPRLAAGGGRGRRAHSERSAYRLRRLGP